MNRSAVDVIEMYTGRVCLIFQGGCVVDVSVVPKKEIDSELTTNPTVMDIAMVLQLQRR